MSCLTNFVLQLFNTRSILNVKPFKAFMLVEFLHPHFSFLVKLGIYLLHIFLIVQIKIFLDTLRPFCWNFESVQWTQYVVRLMLEGHNYFLDFPSKVFGFSFFINRIVYVAFKNSDWLISGLYFGHPFCAEKFDFLDWEIDMEVDKAIRECDDRRLKTKYNNAIHVIKRALALYS